MATDEQRAGLAHLGNIFGGPIGAAIGADKSAQAPTRKDARTALGTLFGGPLGALLATPSQGFQTVDETSRVAEGVVRRGSDQNLVDLAENPFIAQHLDAQTIVDERIRPKEQAELDRLTGLVRQGFRNRQAASATLDRQLAARRGFGGTAFQEALSESRRNAQAGALGGMLAQQQADYQQRLNSPERFELLDRIAQAQQDFADKQANIARIGGAVLSVVPYVGSLGEGAMGAAADTERRMGGEAATRFSPSNVEAEVPVTPMMGSGDLSLGGSGAESAGGFRSALERERMLQLGLNP